MEENFLELLEAYLSNEEIEMKKREDCQDFTTKKNSFRKTPFSIKQTITIGKYVNHYLGIQGDYSNLLHCGLKDLQYNYVMGVDNEFANQNPELVYNGYLLLVMDSHNNRGTYMNPIYLKYAMLEEQLEKEYKVFSRILWNDLKSLTSYYQKYMDLVNRIEMNQKFLELLETTHKTKKFRKLLKEERRKQNDQY